jgi:hypothetical protein
MKSLAVAGFMLAIISIWAVGAYDPSTRDRLSAEATATSFLLYRQAVNAYGLRAKTAGVAANKNLALPAGLPNNLPWKNQIVWQENELRCYVYGPATPVVGSAVFEMMRGSASVGWAEKGKFNGVALPGTIASGSLVSVIIVDRR